MAAYISRSLLMCVCVCVCVCMLHCSELDVRAVLM